MTYDIKNGRYKQRCDKVDGKPVTTHIPTDRKKKPSAYLAAVGDEKDLIDEKISELYAHGMGAEGISKTLRYEDGIKIGKNPVTARLKHLGVYKGDRRNKVVKIDHRAIEEEKDAKITELERVLERTKYRLGNSESKLSDCRKENVRFRDERNESDKKLRLSEALQ